MNKPGLQLSMLPLRSYLTGAGIKKLRVLADDEIAMSLTESLRRRFDTSRRVLIQIDWVLHKPRIDDE